MKDHKCFASQLKDKSIVFIMLIIILSVALLVPAFAFADGSGTCGANLTWTLQDGNLTISGTGKMTNYNSTSRRWGGLPEKIVSITIEEGVTSIGNFAFYGCSNLTSISIPEGVITVGEQAFYNCKRLISINIPESLKSIGSDAFANCQQLSEIHISTMQSWLSIEYDSPRSRPNYGGSIIHLYQKETEITDILVPDDVTDIGDYAFYNCSSISNVTMHDNVIRVGNYAFYGCSSLLDITMSDSIESIESYAFYGCSSLANIEIPRGVSQISFWAFGNCKAITDIVIPEGVTKIVSSAFCYCSGLVSITIPDSVTSIGDAVFFNCSKLQNITIPDSVTSMGDSIFLGCSSLISVTISQNITSIGDHTFASCSSLETISIPTSVTSIGNAAFSGCRSLESMTIPQGVTILGNQLFSNCESLKNIAIPDGVTSIGEQAFSSCSNLLSITIPETMRYIGANAFSGCEKLTDIYISSILTWTTIEYVNDKSHPNNNGNDIVHLYLNGSEMTSASIPDGVTQICDHAFSRCGNIESIIIPDSVTSIGQNAFYNCIKLKNITIPDGVTAIGANAFINCKRLRNITIPNSVTRIGHNAFQMCSGLASISIPGSVTTIEEEVFYNCSSLLEVTLLDGVTSIGKNAFSTCYKLTSITLPESLTCIENRAFMHCTSLPSITIPKNVSNIKDEAFLYCYNLRAISIMAESTIYGINLLSSSPTVYCYEYSDADTWAIDNNYNVVYLDSMDPSIIQFLELPTDYRLELGETQKLAVNIFPIQENPTIEWSSSDDTVISIIDGVATALNIGTATITASIGSFVDSIEITVYIPLNSFELNEKEAWIVAKESLQLFPVNILPMGAEVELSWSYGPSDVAEIDFNGLVTTKKIGTVYISAQDRTGITSKCVVHVCYPVTEVTFENAQLDMPVESTKQLIANVKMRTQNCINHLITFTSSDENVATVDETGVVSAHHPGTTVITATAASGITAECIVNVHTANVLTLPSNTTVIEEAAFSGLTSVDIIVLPDTVIEIADDAFVGSDIVISAPEGSYAKTWAIEHGIPIK